MSELNTVALDPARSVVVEACAGSGKTWLLASRIIRLLLAGAAPGEILAITFTRKAAREIEERVVDWLRLLATADDEAASAFLGERSVALTPAVLQLARGLYERVSGAQPGLAVNTFHGWFLQLCAAAPLSANLAGTSLVEPGSRLFDELWQSFAAALQAKPEDEAASSFVWLLTEIGLNATQTLIRRGAERRAEWLAYSENFAEPRAEALDDLRRMLGVDEAAPALDQFFTPGWDGEFHGYLGFLEASELDTDRKFAAALDRALVCRDPEMCFKGLREVFLTGTGTLRSRKASKALDKRFGADGAARFLEFHAALGGRLLLCVAARVEERIYAFNRHALAVFVAFLAHVEAFKAARRQIDFTDAEWRVLQLLRDEETAGFIQARLDSRYRHVLLDEFQDTNPLQWQILLAWLDAYGESARPSVFMVGDPKQSIYRFRRAEPKLFAAAADFLETRFSAARLAQDATRRNAQPIVDVVNALFAGEALFQPFRQQTSLAGALAGRVELMPLCSGETPPEAPPREGLRDPLAEPDCEPVDTRRRREAGLLAEKIAAIVAGWQIADKDGRPRPAGYGDIMLLVRRRTQLAEYEGALAAAGIPYSAASRGGLLATLEARDLVALLEFLVTPVADLQLAQALKSPLFACGDDDLLQLAARPEASWWRRLAACAAAGEASPRLARAARLLADWLLAASRLPAHDLLDRIYHQGEVLARYRLAVPAPLAAGVEANLRALLLLALDLDGGRYPSLPRFIDELRELRTADAGDAPDEGAIVDAAMDAGRVRILTVHGAKGLEAPIVWLLDAHAGQRGDDAWETLVAWPPEAAQPTHFSFVGRKDERGARRGPLFEAEAAAAAREELNLLYVAITRARQVFIASGVAGERDSEGTPYRRLEAALDALGVDVAAGAAHGDALPCRPPGAVVAPGAACAIEVPPAPPPVGERRALPDAAARFGILLHALLERRTGTAAAEGWWRELGFADGDYQQVRPIAERLLAAPSLQRFFDPARFGRAWNEAEIADAAGQVRRIDRLVEAGDAVWVLDYKSSSADTARLAEYRRQVADYCRAVQSVFPQRPVRGALIFADASLLEIETA